MSDWLFSTEGFTARAQCGTGWSPSLIALYQIASTIIFLCYILIPAGVWRLYRAVQRGRPVRMPVVGCVFTAAFVSSCGLTHLMDRMMFAWPVYHLSTVVLCICALSSIAMLVWLFLADFYDA